MTDAISNKQLRDIPFFWLDCKGGHWKAPVSQPLEVSYIISHGLSSIECSDSKVLAYPKDMLAELRKSIYAGCIDNGTMDEIEAKSKKLDIKNMVSVFNNAFLFFEHGLNQINYKGEIWMPIWKAEYEKPFIDMLLDKSEKKDQLRVVEMSQVSAMAVDLYGMEHPTRGSDWRSLESLMWYYKRTRQIFGIDSRV